MSYDIAKLAEAVKAAEAAKTTAEETALVEKAKKLGINVEEYNSNEKKPAGQVAKESDVKEKTKDQVPPKEVEADLKKENKETKQEVAAPMTPEVLAAAIAKSFAEMDKNAGKQKTEETTIHM